MSTFSYIVELKCIHKNVQKYTDQQFTSTTQGTLSVFSMSVEYQCERKYITVH